MEHIDNKNSLDSKLQFQKLLVLLYRKLCVNILMILFINILGKQLFGITQFLVRILEEHINQLKSLDFRL